MLMNANFNLRKEMFGAEALGARNVEMIDTARGRGPLPSSPAAAAQPWCCARRIARRSERRCTRTARRRGLRCVRRGESGETIGRCRVD